MREGVAINYYEHHLGDYAEATAHLSFVEDAAYSRLIRKYYASEKPLPADLKQVQRLIGARTREEKSAVEVVLEEFFFLEADGWRNTRCDLEIARYNDSAPEREAKKANEDNRLKRHREERSRLFKTLTEAGGHAPWNIKIDELREIVKRITETTLPPLPETAPATPATATQSPVAIHHTPDVNPLPKSVSCTQPELREQPVASTRKGEVCGLLRNAGMADAAPHYLDEPTWEAILSKRTDEEIVELARAKMAARPGQRTGLKYIAPALLEDPAPIAANARASPGFVSQRDQQRQEVIEVLTGKKSNHERTEPAAIDADYQRLAG